MRPGLQNLDGAWFVILLGCSDNSEQVWLHPAPQIGVMSGNHLLV